MTNRSLEISGTSIEDEFKVSRCDMLNDWESIGYCLPLLNDEDFIQLKEGQRNPEETSIAIGPGTGLGFSILRYINNIHMFLQLSLEIPKALMTIYSRDLSWSLPMTFLFWKVSYQVQVFKKSIGPSLEKMFPQKM